MGMMIMMLVVIEGEKWDDIPSLEYSMFPGYESKFSWL